MLYELGKLSPKVSKSSFIAPNASVIGDVMLSDHVSIWFNVVIRADNASIAIGKNSNIQIFKMELFYMLMKVFQSPLRRM